MYVMFSAPMVCNNFVPNGKAFLIPPKSSDLSFLLAIEVLFKEGKPGNHPNFEKNALGVKRPFSEQLSEFRGILGAILGMALAT